MDWIKFGWGSNFSPEFNKHSRFYVDVSNAEYSNADLLEVSTSVINEIVAKYPPPYYLMVSGGIDSQALLWCWLNSNVPFVPVSVRYIGAPEYKEVLNEHDLEELEKFSLKHKINIKYIDFDIVKFLENELNEYAIKYQCTSPQICSHMKMSELVDGGTTIFSGNFILGFHYTYTILGLKRYADSSERSCIPFFFLHDKKLAGLRNRNDYGEGYDGKVEFYRDLGIPVIPQNDKQTGFEIIKDYYDTRTDLVVTATEKLQFMNMPSKRKFDLLFRYRLMKEIRYQDKVIYVGIKQYMLGPNSTPSSIRSPTVLNPTFS